MRKNFKGLFVALLLALAIIIPACAAPAPATKPTPAPTPTPAPAPKEDAAAFYKGKTLTFMNSKPPGGGYDELMRAMIPFVEKYTGATVAPKYETGAGGITAANMLYTTIKRDGLTVLLAPGAALALTQILEQPECKYDAAKFNWIVRPNYDTAVLWVSASSPAKSLKDLQAMKEVSMGLPGKWSVDSLRNAASIEAWGMTNVQFVDGYTGSPEIAMAVMRGELNADIRSIESALKLLQAKEGIPLVTIDDVRDSYLPDVPTIYEVGVNKDKKKWLDWWTYKMGKIQRLIWAPPEVPVERVKFLQDSFMKAITDKEFQANMKKLNRSVMPMTGEEAFKKTGDAANLTKAEKDELNYLVGQKFYK